jgi:hypothetical protein
VATKEPPCGYERAEATKSAEAHERAEGTKEPLRGYENLYQGGKPHEYIRDFVIFHSHQQLHHFRSRQRLRICTAYLRPAQLASLYHISFAPATFVIFVRASDFVYTPHIFVQRS